MKTELQAKESHVTSPDITCLQVTLSNSTQPDYHVCGVVVEDYTGNEARQVCRRSRKEHLPQSAPKFLFTWGKTTVSSTKNVRAM